MRRLLAGLLCILTCFSAKAQVVGTYPYTFSNGTVIDAGQVNADFAYVASQVNTNAAGAGTNSTITAILGLTTPLSAGQGGSSVYTASVSTGSANAQVVGTTSPSGFALVGRPTIIFTAGYTNTGAVQLNVNSTGLTNLYKPTIGGPAVLTGSEIVAGNLIVATYDGTQYELSSQVPLFQSLAGVTNFTAINDTVAPTIKVNLNSSRAILINASGSSIQFISPAQCVIDFSTTGTYGGLDTGTIASNTWYYTYYVSNGTSLGCFASLSATAPSISAAYFSVRVGAIRTDGSSHLLNVSQQACGVTYIAQPTITPNASPQAISTIFPPTSRQWTVNLATSTSSAGSVSDHAGHICGSNSFGASNAVAQNITCSNVGANFTANSVSGTNAFVAYGWVDSVNAF
jgi:hypothetical protein